MTLQSVPTLTDVVENPEMIHTLPVQVRAALIVQIANSIVASRPELAPPAKDEPDQLLDLNQAASRLGLKPKTLKNCHSKPPWAALKIDNGKRCLRFSAKRIARFIERRTG